MNSQPSVAVLLATYNGSKHIDAQIRSLSQNSTAFSLHWLDDHSTDNTRELVQSAALSSGINLRECHQPEHQGLPGAFFKLLECVDADIYMFCDQDDIWQPGKIDATVRSLVPDLDLPVLCFSESLVFSNNDIGTLHRLYDKFRTKPATALQEMRAHMTFLPAGHTQGLTRPLREIFLRHKDIACEYSGSHDAWMYLIAVASGTTRMLYDVPTALYRHHGNNATEFFFNAKSIREIWRLQQMLRPIISRQAEGFILASSGLPPSLKLNKLVKIAKMISTIDRRQRLTSLVRLAFMGAMWPNRWHSFWLAVACLFSDAKPSARTPFGPPRSSDTALIGL